MSKISLERTEIDGLYVITPKIFGDERGYFMETYNQAELEEELKKMERSSVTTTKMPTNYNFVQDNQSSSCKGVLRGLHYQIHYPQAKLVRALVGEVYDVVVDIRKESRTYGKWCGNILSEQNHKQFLIPRGCAHGFLVLSDIAVFAYKSDEFYHPGDEGGILWNSVGINWPLEKLQGSELILSEKDKKWQPRNM